MAGYVAECRALDVPLWRTTADDIRHNMRHRDLRDAAAALGTEDPAVLLAVWDQAARIVDQHWRDIELIAEVLLQVGTLTGEDLRLLWPRVPCGARRAVPPA